MNTQNHFFGPIYLIASGSIIILAAFLWRSLPVAVPDTVELQQVTPLPTITIVKEGEIDFSQSENKFIILDVRSAEAYTASHIPGAVNLPAEQVSGFDFSQFSNQMVVIYGAQSDNWDSISIAEQMLSLGYANIQVLSGGFDAWVETKIEAQ